VRQRPAVAFLGWTPNSGRAMEIAAALGGEARTFFALSLVHRAAIPVRYALDAIRTIAYLVVARPRATIVINPPIFPALIALAYGRATGAPLVLDSHPSAFGLAGDSVSRRLLPVHAWVARRAKTTLVSAPALAEVVRSWGARADVLHEAPPAWRVSAARPPGERATVLFAGVFAGDEPVDQVVEAARAVPSIDVVITGDLRKCPEDLVAGAPSNVRFVGFLDPGEYVRALEESDAVLSLSTEPASVMRTAHEAVWAGRPLVVTGWPDLRRLFPDAVHVSNDAGAIADGLREVMRRHSELVTAAPVQRRAQEARWEEQLSTLRSQLGVVDPPS
jgi:glycosyltransferase involved in cell wall biosynthesis